MATLPDIDTSNVGGITFYNVKDEQGVSDADFDPMDFSDWSELADVEIYDNGIDGYIESDVETRYDSSTEIIARFRCKNDGWLICWSPTTSNYFGSTEYTDGTTPDLIGAYNFYGVASNKNPWIILFDALSHAGYGVGPSDGETVLGHYNFGAEGASNITSCVRAEGVEFSYTSSVDRKFHYTVMNNDRNIAIEGGDDAILSTSTVEVDGYTYTSLDLLNQAAQGWTFTADISSATTYVVEDTASRSVGDCKMVSAWS